MFISYWLCIVILFSYRSYFLLVGYALPLLWVLLCCYCSLRHYFFHIFALFFLHLHYLIALRTLLRYSFNVVAFIFSSLLLYFFHPYLDVLYALPCYSFCIASLFLSCCFTLLVLLWCFFHIVSLFFSWCCVVFLTLPLLFFLHYAYCFFHVVLLHHCTPHITIPLELVLNLQVLIGPILDVTLFTLLLLIFLCCYCSCFLGWYGTFVTGQGVC